jgi:hypothetical protein
MAQWYINNKRRFREDRKALASHCPLMRLAVVGPDFRINSEFGTKNECAVAHGTYTIQIPNSKRQIEYSIVLLFPNNYPKSAPKMYCNDPKLPIGNIDRHIMKDGYACLGVQAAIGKRWNSGPTLVLFLNNLVTPFLVWQSYYEEYKKPPPWGELSHYKDGVLEYYAELLCRPVDDSIIGFMRLLARKNRPKGHEFCPCGSGKRLRDCRSALLYDTREKVSWKDVEIDLAFLERSDRI